MVTILQTLSTASPKTLLEDWERRLCENHETKELKDNQVLSCIHPFGAELLPKVEKKIKYQEKYVILRYFQSAKGV